MNTEGETLISDQASWVWIGFKFGIGFGLAGCIFTFLGALIVSAYTSAEVDRTTKEFKKAVNNSFPQQYQAPEVQHHYRTIAVPPKTGQECLKETGGVLNEEYQRCNAGYSYNVQID